MGRPCCFWGYAAAACLGASVLAAAWRGEVAEACLGVLVELSVVVVASRSGVVRPVVLVDAVAESSVSAVRPVTRGFFLGVVVETVDGNYRFFPELLGILNVLFKVW